MTFWRYKKIHTETLLVFWDMPKRKGNWKSCHLFVIFTFNLSDLDVIYKYVARHGCLPLWFRQRFLWTGI